MGMAFGMTLPGLVLLLLAAAVVEHVLSRRTPVVRDPDRLHPERRSAVSGAGFDVLGVAFDPATRHALEQRDHERLWREDDEEGAPPRSRVDLEAGIATLRVPRA